MFDIGFLEMLTIGIVALVVIGPERLPEVATKVGRYVGKAQRFVRGVRSDISRELESGDLKKLIGDQKEQIDELRQMVKSATKDLEESTGGAMKDARHSLNEMKSDVADSLKSESSLATSTSANHGETDNTEAATVSNSDTRNTAVDAQPQSSESAAADTQQKNTGS